MGKAIRREPAKVLDTLQAYHWPGNLRELENVVERAVINSQGISLQLLDKLDVAPTEGKGAGSHLTLEAVERASIVQVLEETKGRVDGPKGAATILGLNPSTLRSRMQKPEIQKNVSVE